MNNKKYKVVVIGAGLTGLSFAYHFDRNVPVFEKNNVVGGLVRTISHKEYKFDLAPHVLHLRSEYVKNLLFKIFNVSVKPYNRKASIYFEDKLIPYPFELNLYQLSSEIKNECLDGLSETITLDDYNEKKLRAGTYENYALKAFGEGIANNYLLPYNRKIWDTNPADMNCEWMRYLPTVNSKQIKINAMQPNTNEFGYNTYFYYPNVNGIQELPNAFKTQLSNVQLNKGLSNINVQEKILGLNSGEKIQYEHLISTIPLNRLVQYTNLNDLKEDAKQLAHTTVYTFNFVIEGDIPEGMHWIYFPDPKLIFYRISFPKNYYSNATPYKNQIISVEVGSKNHHLNNDQLLKKVKNQISQLEIFKIKKIIANFYYKIPVAYCIYDYNRSKTVNKILNTLRNVDIISAGRYGYWEYSAMEDAILYGKKMAEELKNKL